MNRLMHAVLDGDPLLTPSGLWTKAGRLQVTRTPGGRPRYRRSVVVALLEEQR